MRKTKMRYTIIGMADREHEEWLGDHQMARHRYAGVVQFRRAHKRPTRGDDDDERKRRDEEDAQQKRLKNSRELF